VCVGEICVAKVVVAELEAGFYFCQTQYLTYTTYLVDGGGDLLDGLLKLAVFVCVRVSEHPLPSLLSLPGARAQEVSAPYEGQEGHT
jgi:hypothetical protein